MRQLPQQPLLWFFVIAATVFLIDGRRPADEQVIHVTAAQETRLATLWQTQTGVLPTPDELASLVDSWIQEEILYREALRLGLDRDDSIIRRRLIQKLGFIAESGLGQPADREQALQDFYQDNLADYTLPQRFSIRQLYFSSLEAAQAALQKSDAGEDIANLGERSMLNASFAYRSALDLNATFGAGFAEPLGALEPGRWDGPVPSGFGYHLIFLVGVHPPEISPFESIKTQVAQDYLAYREAQARDGYMQELLDSYTIIRAPQ